MTASLNTQIKQLAKEYQEQKESERAKELATRRVDLVNVADSKVIVGEIERVTDPDKRKTAHRTEEEAVQAISRHEPEEDLSL